MNRLPFLLLFTRSLLFACLIVLFSCKNAASPDTPSNNKPIRFTKKVLAKETYESVGVFDVNKDGKLDVVSGAYWYAGPQFIKRYFMYEVKPEGEFFDDFSTIPVDVNGDGFTDFVTGGWWGANPPLNSEPWRYQPLDRAWLGTMRKH